MSRNWRDSMLSRLRARDPPISVVVPPRERVRFDFSARCLSRGLGHPKRWRVTINDDYSCGSLCCVNWLSHNTIFAQSRALALSVHEQSRLVGPLES